MIKAIPYFFLGFVAGLVFVELTNGKPAVKAKQYEAEQIPHSQDTHFTMKTVLNKILLIIKGQTIIIRLN